MADDHEPTIAFLRQIAPATPSHAPFREPVASAALLQGARTVEISHNGVIYKLQATRQGKLILTK